MFCQSALPADDVPPGGGGAQCRSCHRVTELMLFPALAGRPPALSVEPAAEGEATCFYSPNRRATKSCSHCGVLISDAWAAQWGSQTVCLKCLEHLRGKGSDARFQTSRTLWDNVALAVALTPFTVVLWFAAFITAPASVFLALWHWNSPRSMVPRSRLRLVLALLLGVAQLGVGAVLFLKVWFRPS